MRSSALALLHLLLAILLAFDGMGAAFAAAGPAAPAPDAAHAASGTPPCHSTASDSDAVADATHERRAPAPDSCCDGSDCLCLHGCGSVLPAVPRIAASTGGTVVAAHVPEDRVAPRLDDPVRPPISRA